MKSLKFVFYVLMFLPLLGTMLSLVFLPDQVPAHYGLGGQVTRWGSKYETLVLPVFTIFLVCVCWDFQRFPTRRRRRGGIMKKFVSLQGLFLC